MTTTARLTSLTVAVDGVTLTDVLSASVQLGFNMHTSQATISVASLPAGLEPLLTSVTVTMGGTSATASLRFTGFFVEAEHQLYPHEVKLICRGPLHRAEIYECNQVSGVDMSSAGTGHTDEVMVATILFICGVITGVYDPAPVAIEGTGETLGTVANGKGFNWDLGQSGLDWINSLDSVCLGYRTFDTASGTVVRQQISAIPSGAPSATFTAGVDILRATSTDTISEARNRVIVTGFSPGKDKTQADVQAANAWLLGAEISGENPTGQFYLTHQLSSSMIEKALAADAGSGLGCDEVAAWLLAEKNVRLVKTQLTTHRDDNIAPGAVIRVHAATRLGLTNHDFWVQQVEPSIDRAGNFTQTFTLLGVIAEPA